MRGKAKRHGLGRRQLRWSLVALLTAVAALVAGLGASSASNEATGNPIKLGVLTSLTGTFTPWGIQTRAGMALAVNEINRTGGVKGRGQGRLLNLAVADDQSTNTNAGIDGFRRLTQQDRVVAVGGVIGSNIGAGDRAARRSRRRCRCSWSKRVLTRS